MRGADDSWKEEVSFVVFIVEDGFVDKSKAYVLSIRIDITSRSQFSLSLATLMLQDVPTAIALIVQCLFLSLLGPEQ